MLITLFNFLLIILGFGLLIFVHELGHFLAARWAGIRTEAFAVGMGPVMLAWRKGIGFVPKSTHSRVVSLTGKAPADLSDAELKQHDLGETEYSLRWLPIGGFVKMLGQEDANPNYVSDDPRSYNRCSIGKRMIVVSAGVIMNLILAAVLFIVVFMVGVQFPAPVIGDVSSTLPAGTTMPENAESAGITTPGLRPGDHVIEIDGKPARTFSDIQISAAMSRPDRPVRFTVDRPGVDDPLHFVLQPQHDQAMGLLAIGVAPASSTQLMADDRKGEMRRVLTSSGLAQQGVEPGMKLIEVNGEKLETFQQFNEIVQRSQGEPIHTRWQPVRDGPGELSKVRGTPNFVLYEVEATIELAPMLEVYRHTDAAPEAVQNFDTGLLGLSPLVRITSVAADSPNHGILQDGDVVLRAGDHVAPRLSQFFEIVRNHRENVLPMEVLRNGERVQVEAQTERIKRTSDQRRLRVGVGLAVDEPYFAEPVETDTPVASHTLLPGSRIEAINGNPVTNWMEFRSALRSAIGNGHSTGATFDITISHAIGTATRLPNADSRLPIVETIIIELTDDQTNAILALGWSSPLGSYLFEPIHTVVSAGKNPGRALVMGMQETHKMVMLTYLTIDRLFRGTVGVEQLRGPVGIIHLGATIAERGMLYLLFLLAVISVNLAVINFLPLPIVDGGLFLFLIYEKLKGKPPSIAFQNAVTIVGLMLIGGVFLIVTYHDIMRLVS